MPHLSILVVEDDPDAAHLINRDIARHRASMTHVSSMAEATTYLLALQRRRFDAILLDLSLPDAKGITAVQRVRELTDTPIVVLTGLDDPDDRFALEAIAQGAQDWLPKLGTTVGQMVRSVRLAIARDRLSKARVAAGL